MGFIEDKHVSIQKTEDYFADELPDPEDAKITINLNNFLLDQDLQTVIYTFEVEASNWSEDDYAVAYHYKDVYGLRNFSWRVVQQLNYYPGMHQTETPPGEDPAKTQAKKMGDNRLEYWNRSLDNPDAFMSGLKTRQQDFDYREIFGKDTSAEDRAKGLGEVLTKCVPCFDRLLDGADLLPDGDLLELHLLNIKVRTDVLDKLKALLSDPGYYLDICELLNLFSSLCPQDLLALLSLFTQYLARLNLDIKFNIDIIVSLVGPILSPFLDSISSWLDKWIQMILAPLICVMDHINEIIYLAQQAKIPFSEASANVETDIGVALPFHQNISLEDQAKADVGAPGAWVSGEFSRFSTPDDEKYRPSVPEYPTEETRLSAEELGEEWGASSTPAEREARDAKFKELRKKEREKRRVTPPPLRRENPDGHRWYKEDADDISTFKFQTGMRPPEEQRHPKSMDQYYLDPSPIVNSVIQLRNMMQAGIAYVQDWFEYITQMIHDLIGTDFGWMSKKTDNSIIKSRLIQLIYVLRAVMQAISRNGLECGLQSNFDEKQMKYILEIALNSISNTYQFAANPDGSISVVPPDGPLHAETIEISQGEISKPTIATTGETPISTEVAAPGIPATSETGKAPEQESVSSGIIIKNCLKKVSSNDVDMVKQWIADFERGGS
jgi:hypothetical protein